MADVLAGGPPESPRGAADAEVETELEDNDEEDQCDAAQAPLGEVPEEVAEAQDSDGEGDAESRPISAASSRLRPPSAGGTSAASGGHGTARERSQSQDYRVPEASREVWKQFGCDTKAGRALRGLYGSGSHAAARVSYPRLQSPARTWEPEKAPRKPCPQRAAVRVPRPAPRPTLDRDDPRAWPADLACPKRKPAAEILAEMEAATPEIPDLPKGRDQNSEKEMLQDNFRYCGGRMMPKGAMGHVPAGEMPKATPKVLETEIDMNGMTAEQREIFQELVLSVQRKQARIAEIDAEDKKDARPSKKKTERNKEALELRNAMDVCLKDIDKLLAITADDAEPR